MNLHLFEIICPDRLVVLKIHDNVFWDCIILYFVLEWDVDTDMGDAPWEYIE